MTKRPANSSKVCRHFSGHCCLVVRYLLFPWISDYDYIFADDERESNPTSFKFLQMAHAWKASGGGGLLSGFTASAANAKDDESEEESDEDDEKSSKAGDDEPMDQDQESVASSKGDD